MEEQAHGRKDFGGRVAGAGFGRVSTQMPEGLWRRKFERKGLEQAHKRRKDLLGKVFFGKGFGGRTLGAGLGRASTQVPEGLWGEDSEGGAWKNKHTNAGRTLGEGFWGQDLEEQAHTCRNDFWGRVLGRKTLGKDSGRGGECRQTGGERLWAGWGVQANRCRKDFGGRPWG